MEDEFEKIILKADVEGYRTSKIRRNPPHTGPCNNFKDQIDSLQRHGSEDHCEDCGFSKGSHTPGQVFDARSIQQAISPTLPPCVNCESANMIAVRRIDLLYAVTACIDCNHRRQLTEDEYLAEWPEA